MTFSLPFLKYCIKKTSKTGTNKSKGWEQIKESREGVKGNILYFQADFTWSEYKTSLIPRGCAVHHSSPPKISPPWNPMEVTERPEESFRSPVMCGMRWTCLGADSPWPAVPWQTDMAGRFFSHLDLLVSVTSRHQVTSCVLFSMYTPPSATRVYLSLPASRMASLLVRRVSMPVPCMVWFHLLKILKWRSMQHVYKTYPLVNQHKYGKYHFFLRNLL